MPGIIVPPVLPGPSLGVDQTWTGTDTFTGPLKVGSGAPWYDVTASPFNAKGDTKTVTDGAMTSGSAILTCSTSAAFTAADVGKQISVMSASSTAMRLSTTVATFVNATTITVATAPTLTTTVQTVVVDGSQRATDGVTTANSTTVTSATAVFTAADVGKAITFSAAAAIALNTTISAFTNSTTVTLAASATRTCSAVQVIYGSNDTAAFQSATTAALNKPHAVVYVPEGNCLVAYSASGIGAIQLYSNTIFKGDGWGSIIRGIGGYSSVASEIVAVN